MITSTMVTRVTRQWGSRTSVVCLSVSYIVTLRCHTATHCPSLQACDRAHAWWKFMRSCRCFFGSFHRKADQGVVFYWLSVLFCYLSNCMPVTICVSVYCSIELSWVVELSWHFQSFPVSLFKIKWQITALHILCFSLLLCPELSCLAVQ